MRARLGQLGIGVYLAFMIGFIYLAVVILVLF